MHICTYRGYTPVDRSYAAVDAKACPSYELPQWLGYLQAVDIKDGYIMFDMDAILTLDQLNANTDNQCPAPDEALATWTDKLGIHHECLVSVIWEYPSPNKTPRVKCRSYSDGYSPNAYEYDYPIFYNSKFHELYASNRIIKSTLRFVAPGRHPNIMLINGDVITYQSIDRTDGIIEVRTLDGNVMHVPSSSVLCYSDSPSSHDA